MRGRSPSFSFTTLPFDTRIDVSCTFATGTPVTTLKQQNIAFKSITENIDTSTATGQLVFHLFGALAEFERNLNTERTMAGLDAARTRGRKGGRPKLNTAAGKVAMAKKLYRDWTIPIPEICKTLHILKATLYRWVNAGGGNLAKP